MHLPEISSRVAIGGLVGLALLDVVLVGAALQSTRGADIDARPVVSAPSPSPSPSSTNASPTSPLRATTPPAAPLRTILVAVDSQQAWRAGVGSCSAGGASLAMTADGGKTWVEGKAPPLRVIVRVLPTDGRAALVVGADASCTVRLSQTNDGAGTWAAAGTAEGAWLRDPGNPRGVMAPGPTPSQPCGKRNVLDLAVASAESARVLCADGSVRSSSNTGLSWTTSGTVTGAVALAVPSADPSQTYVARLQAPSCPGVQILRVGERVATSCIRSALPKASGQIALSLVRGGGWATVGGTTLRSTDNLVTWSTS